RVERTVAAGEHRGGAGAEAGRQRLAELLELRLVHLADRVEHDEQTDEDGHHVRVADRPALVVLLLLDVLDPAALASVAARATPRAHAASAAAPLLGSGGMRLRRR